MPGLLDRFFSNPGQADALGLLGAYLMQAGAETTDPGASSRMLGQGMQGYLKALSEGRKGEETRAYRKAQLADIESRTEERETARLGKARARNALVMGPGGPRVGAQGLLSRVPESQRALIQGMAAADPTAAYKAALGAVKPQDRYETAQDPYGLGGVGQRNARTGQITGYQKPAAPDRTLTQVYDPTSPTGTRLVPRAEAKGKPGRPGMGGKVTQTAGGGLEVLFGPGVGTAGKMTKPTTTDIEKKLLAANEGHVRLQNISATFKPEYQELGTRWDALVTSWTAKVRGAGAVSPEDTKHLRDYAKFRRDAFSHMNRYIKDITGAQMSEFEAKRLRKAIPDPGDTLFGGDDPITFKAKLDSAMREIAKAKARYTYYLNKGIQNVGEMSRLTPLDTMPVAVNQETGQRIVRIGDQWVDI